MFKIGSQVQTLRAINEFEDAKQSYAILQYNKRNDKPRHYVPTGKEWTDNIWPEMTSKERLDRDLLIRKWQESIKELMQLVTGVSLAWATTHKAQPFFIFMEMEKMWLIPPLSDLQAESEYIAMVRQEEKEYMEKTDPRRFSQK